VDSARERRRSQRSHVFSGRATASLRGPIWNPCLVPSTGEIIAELVDLEEGYITYTPDGYYTASPEGDALVVLRANDNSLTNDEAIKARYRRPDIVEARLSVLMS